MHFRSAAGAAAAKVMLTDRFRPCCQKPASSPPSLPPSLSLDILSSSGSLHWSCTYQRSALLLQCRALPFPLIFVRYEYAWEGGAGGGAVLHLRQDTLQHLLAPVGGAVDRHRGGYTQTSCTPHTAQLLSFAPSPPPPPPVRRPLACASSIHPSMPPFPLSFAAAVTLPLRRCCYLAGRCSRCTKE